MLEVRKLSLHAGNFSLRNIDLTVERGSCHVVLGPTGSGKTLLLETIMGFRKSREGKILHFGEEITNLPPEKRKISYLPQDLALFPNMNVRENILYGIKVRRIINESHLRLFEALTNMLGITHLLQRQVTNLSGGERQRVALARALVTGNRTLLLDEPLSALHESMRRDLWMLIKELQEEFHLNILMVTHDVEEAFFLANHLSVIYDGSVLQTSGKETFFYEIKDVRVAELVGVRNIFQAELSDVGTVESRFFCHDLSTIIVAKTPAHPVVGKKYFLGIHSNDIEVTKKKPDGAANTVPIKITHIYEKIKSVMIEGKAVSGKTITAEESPKLSKTLKPGQKVFAVFSIEDVLVMDQFLDGSIHTGLP